MAGIYVDGQRIDRFFVGAFRYCLRHPEVFALYRTDPRDRNRFHRFDGLGRASFVGQKLFLDPCCRAFRSYDELFGFMQFADESCRDALLEILSSAVSFVYGEECQRMFDAVDAMRDSISPVSFRDDLIGLLHGEWSIYRGRGRRVTGVWRRVTYGNDMFDRVRDCTRKVLWTVTGPVIDFADWFSGLSWFCERRYWRFSLNSHNRAMFRAINRGERLPYEHWVW